MSYSMVKELSRIQDQKRRATVRYTKIMVRKSALEELFSVPSPWSSRWSSRVICFPKYSKCMSLLGPREKSALLAWMSTRSNVRFESRQKITLSIDQTRDKSEQRIVPEEFSPSIIGRLLSFFCTSSCNHRPSCFQKSSLFSSSRKRVRSVILLPLYWREASCWRQGRLIWSSSGKLVSSLVKKLRTGCFIVGSSTTGGEGFPSNKKERERDSSDPVTASFGWIKIYQPPPPPHATIFRWGT